MIITSLLDTDIYKLYTQQFILLTGLGLLNVEYKLFTRNKDMKFTSSQVTEIREEINNLGTLSFSKEDIRVLKDFSPTYLQFLGNFRLNPEAVVIKEKDGFISLSIEGPWLYICLFETYILSIISEIYYRNTDVLKINSYARQNLVKTTNTLKQISMPIVTEFGTRRRHSKQWQEFVLSYLLQENVINTTSNVYLANRYGLKTVGTIPHEVLMAYQAITIASNGILREDQFELYALADWASIYYKAIPLYAPTDTINTDNFITTVLSGNKEQKEMIKAYNGFKIDSGDNFENLEKLINFSKKLGYNTSTLIFGNSLIAEDVIKLNNVFEKRNRRIKSGLQVIPKFAIGTNLSCDVLETNSNYSAVIKMTRFNGIKVVKLSDEPGKYNFSEQEVTEAYTTLSKVAPNVISKIEKCLDQRK